jgi:hypothetical protein
MLKKALLIGAVFAAGSMGLVSAQDATPVVKHMSEKKPAHPRIVQLKDRIKNQIARIKQGLNAETLSVADANACRAVLNTVQSKMKDECKANGSKKIMSKDTYDAYNTSLDANSAAIHEDKQYFYYYGPYVDYGPNYDYYYDSYPVVGAPTPSVSTMEETHPRIYELKERIKNQRERIQQGLTNNTLNSDQAKDCGTALKSVEDQMTADFKTNGSDKLTKDQFTAFNTSLDSNSTLIQESKQYFYYYDDPNYVQYYWN